MDGGKETGKRGETGGRRGSVSESVGHRFKTGGLYVRRKRGLVKEREKARARERVITRK